MQHIEYAIEETFAKELRDKVYNILATTKNNKGDVQKKLDRILVTFGVTCAKSGIDPDRVDDQLIQTLRHGIRSLIG